VSGQQPLATPRAARWRGLLGVLVPLGVLAGVYLGFALQTPQMFKPRVIEGMVIQTVIVGTAAVGMTLVIIAGGIDLSVGSIIAFSSVAGAMFMARLGVPAGWAVLLAVGAGAACGLCNGAIVTGGRIVPFIVTLGTMMVFRGAAKGLADSAPVDISDRWIGDFMRSLPPEQWWKLLPPGGWAMVLLAAAFWAMLRYTRLGRHAVAVGSNEQTARLCGVAVARVKLCVYALGGACAGLSGVMLLSRQGQGDPTAAVGYELYVIAAVVIGGGSLSGGSGSVLGTIVGALIMTVIRAGCNFRGLQPWVTEVVTGAILVAAVALDRLRHRDGR